jgi:hypothetical protein
MQRDTPTGFSMTAVLQAPRDAQHEARERRRQRWLERVAQELQMAEAWDANKHPEGLGERIDRMVELSSKAEILSYRDKADIHDRASALKLRAYERYLDGLLERTMAATRDKFRQEEKAKLLREVDDVFSTTLHLGTTEAVKDRVKERLDIIRQTSAAGDSSKAKEDAEREAKRRQATGQHEHRTFARWRDPALIVQIEGQSYATVDWSLGGILVAEIADLGWRPGQQLGIKVGLEANKLHPERVEVVRYLADSMRLAIKVRRFASALMQVKHDCKTAGLEPTE